MGRELYSPCFEVSVSSTNGAGDRTIAGFLAAVVRDLDPAEALEMAVAVGAASVESCDRLASQYSWELLKDRIRGGWNRQPVGSNFAKSFQCKSNGCWIGPQNQQTSKAMLTR